MPIFMASKLISENTASSCFSICKIGIGCISKTPFVFCAVDAVITLAANAPHAEILLISACIPAQPPESLPAIVNTLL